MIPVARCNGKAPLARVNIPTESVDNLVGKSR
jgi:hypothetical protein